MMKKLLVLVLAFAIVAPALAEDTAPAVFRGLPGSTLSNWTFDDDVGLFGEEETTYDWPDSSSFVSHPDKEDPWLIDPCLPYFSGMNWGTTGDPCGLEPGWLDGLPGGVRQGGLNYMGGSFQINNFIHDQPAKDIWLQITYFNGTEVPAEFGFGSYGFRVEVIPGDPCGEPMGRSHSGDTPLTEWDYGTWGDPMYTWIDEESGEEYGFSYTPDTALSEWDYETYGDPMYTWDTRDDTEEEVWVDGVMERVSSEVLDDGWLHDVWAITLPMNPYVEWAEGWLGGEPGAAVLIDQLVIETLCYVPEPATMVLLGLGSLMAIRRKKR